MSNTTTSGVDMEMVRVAAHDWDLVRLIVKSQLLKMERQSRERRAMLDIANQSIWCVNQKDSKYVFFVRKFCHELLGICRKLLEES